jgi:hypothetical protein
MTPRLVAAIVAALPFAAAAQSPTAQSPSAQSPSAQQPAAQGSLLPPALRSPVTGQQAAPPKPPWIASGTARLQALDKVNAITAELLVKVGETASFGSLSITVRGCFVRPPDQPQDASAFIEVTDRNPGSDGFRGWLLANAPSVSMMQDPVYEIRVAGCG